jgi:hypothetical protein
LKYIPNIIIKKKIYIISVFFLFFLCTCFTGCQFLELARKVVYKEGSIESRLEAIEIRASKGIEIKESEQKNYSAVITAGDDTDNNQIKGIFVFDIEKLYRHEILRASISISGAHTKSKPFFGEKVIVEAVDVIDFDGEGEFIADFPVGNFLDFIILNDNLKKSIVDAIESGRDKFYLRFELENPTNNDNIEDLVIINLHDAYLKAEFID